MEYGLIGQKLTHSYSKEIHEQLSTYSYELCELADDEAFTKFMEKADFKAINVTIPYKEKVLPYLKKVSDEVKEIKAVNTIVQNENQLYGYNTDYYGIKEMISFFKIPIAQQRVFILGTGGTSKTAYHVAKNLKASEIYFVSRQKKENALTYEEMQTIYAKKVEVIIATTPFGMYPHLTWSPIVNLSCFPHLKGVVDVVYNPLQTTLIIEAKNRKIPCCGGLYMLVAQAFYACELFQNISLKKDKILEIYKRIKKEKENIVLIGMPSCGKSTIGKMLASALHRRFVDIDAIIKEQIQMDIATYFKLYGEETFRKIESEVIQEISKETSLVIATGGGAILKKENVTFLKQNGELIFIDRPLSFLKSTPSRPLTSSKTALKKRYKERYPLYCQVCDIKIHAHSSKEENVAIILKKWEENLL